MGYGVMRSHFGLDLSGVDVLMSKYIRKRFIDHAGR
jgi:hypothetical protein